MSEYKFLVFSNCPEGKDAEFNRWYDDVHLPEVIAIPRFTGAIRMRAAGSAGKMPPHRYLAIYDISTNDVDATLGELMSRAGSGRLQMSETLSPDVETRLYEVITPQRHKT